jgi:hypothetical protein
MEEHMIIDKNKFKTYASQITTVLENPNYKWRTVNGVVKESGLPADVVVTVLTTNTETFLRSSIPANNGEPLFTTRKHFLETATSSEKFLGALKNRIV